MKCDLCGKIKTVKAPWEGKIKGFTLLFEAFALTLLRVTQKGVMSLPLWLPIS